MMNFDASPRDAPTNEMCMMSTTIIVAQLFISYLYDHTTVPGSGNSMAGLLVDKLYNPSAVVITDMESHMSHINHNIELNAGQFVQTFFYRCMLWVQQQDCCNKQLFSVSKYYKY